MPSWHFRSREKNTMNNLLVLTLVVILMGLAVGGWITKEIREVGDKIIEKIEQQ